MRRFAMAGGGPPEKEAGMEGKREARTSDDRQRRPPPRLPYSVLAHWLL